MARQAPDPNCEYCLGTGEVDKPVWNSDAGLFENTDTAPCHCTKADDDEDSGGLDFGDGGTKPIRPIDPRPTPSPITLADIMQTA